MDKNQVTLTPPMGWNSWDCYGASVTEEILKKNAVYMSTNLKKYGWEYIVCDIQWYEPKAKSTEYNAFFPLEMDPYSRLIPAVNRFPSAGNGQGFRPIADYIHSLGLKFGIHIMRGIPRQAVHRAMAIKGTTATARDIAHPYSICSWNTDMYGVNPDADGAQEYYNSLFELYAQWNVDYIKVDDICVTEYKPHDPYSAKREIEMIRKAIDQCGRPMVLSLSPGPAVLSEAEHLSKYANMWRMTGDFWDNWDQLYRMFDYCYDWSPFVKEGCWPDCDMLPIGRVGINTPGHNPNERNTNFTRNEQITMMTLWCIFRSPLMIGSELTALDDWTFKLLTNENVLRLLKYSHDARQVFRSFDTVIWASDDEDGSKYIAFFNTGFSKTTPSINFMNLGINGTYEMIDLWSGETVGEYQQRITTEVDIHGARLFKLIKKNR
ncbi:MAG: glycoside hydrolase family 27 protein [Lachnospiraceae bacterium]|nr:glycoside hydrolase family 27 protein [Lachnospiraceae bacterium]